jgi:hypothetical protein
MMSAHLDVCRHAYDEAKKTGNLPEYSRMMGSRPFIPGFFPPGTIAYPNLDEMNQKLIEKTEPESEGPEKLPWEE